MYGRNAFTGVSVIMSVICSRVLTPILCRFFVVPAVLLLFLTTSHAHFLLNLNVRIMHVEHFDNGFRVYLRTPMPYLVADKVGPEAVGDLPDPAPFTTNARRNGQLVHYVNPAQIVDDPLGLGRLAEDGYVFEVSGYRLRGSVEAMLVHRVGAEPSFATLDEALAAFDSKNSIPVIPPPLYVGDTIIDVVIRYTTGEPVTRYAVSSQLDPGLPDQENTANLILDYGPGDPKVFRSRGLMADPVEISRSNLAGIGTFIWEGIRHIIEGLDHVLFVVCLVIGATVLRSLLWRVTGFTIGHSVTLAIGFFGFVPSGAWFIPAVETGIALSIIYAAIVALGANVKSGRSEMRMFVITVAIGLLHGLGFSFVLHKILQVTSPGIWKSLLAFNLGVEIGQVLIVLAIWPLLQILRRMNLNAWMVSRTAITVGCIAIAVYWTAERISQVSAAII